MTNETARHVRRHSNDARQSLYDFERAIDDGDRDRALHLAKQLVIIAGHLANAVARWYFPSRSARPVDHSDSFFSISVPPTDTRALRHFTTRRTR